MHSSDRFLAEFLRIFNRLAGSADEMGTFIQELSVHFREQAAKVAEMQSQLTTAEGAVDETISKLTISEKEKKALQKQIKELQVSSRAAVSVNIGETFSAMSGKASAISTSYEGLSLSPPIIISTGKQCAKCGTTYYPNYSIPLLGQNSSLCNACQTPFPGPDIRGT